ncbi:trypsin inhibitor ClTI-1-like [Clarias gariepinus]|uniref:trypsin inhibitor ClTI-1-like n=1 Tax=Clarias gariepinus TaxID=13013 RepID=UPI00234C468C|nr:trypsin inhibitor ClTI-1-like [Clarias gariepinus]
MFVRLVLFLIFVAGVTGAVVGDVQSEATCHQYIFPICRRNYAPVCGSNGKTYPNECVFCFDNRHNKLNAYIMKEGIC